MGVRSEVSQAAIDASKTGPLSSSGSVSVLSRRVLVLGALVFVLALGLRLAHANKGLPYLHYWNEPAIAGTALEMMKSGDFNPHFFAYGSVPIYLCMLVDVVHYLHLMGQPATADWHLEDLDDIETGLVPDWANGAPPEWFWRISHPTFFFWNRVLISLFGAATVLAVFLLGERLVNEWVGLVAATLLATQPFHIEMSVQVMPGVPMTFFAVGAVLLSLLYLDGGKLRHLVAALVFCGLAVATKYNAVLVIAAPAVALGLRHWGRPQERRASPWLLLGLIPLGAFLIAMPYALLDFSAFLVAVGREVRHYHVTGHGLSTVPPGWEQMKLQGATFRSQLGLLTSLLVLTGAPLLFRRRALPVFVVPVMYFLFMTRMRVGFHRNFLLLYPFLALLAAFGLYLVYRGAKAAARRSGWKGNPDPWVAALLALAFVVPPAVAAGRSALSAWTRLESRTRAVLSANRLAQERGFSRIVIAEELRVHERDLRRLQRPFVSQSVRAMRLCHDAQSPALYILPDKLDRRPGWHNPEQKRRLMAHHRLRRHIDDSQILLEVGLGGTTHVDKPSLDPTVLLVSVPDDGVPCGR